MDPAALALLALAALLAAPASVLAAVALRERRVDQRDRSWREIAELRTRAPAPGPGAAFAGLGAMGFTRRAP